MKIKTMWKVYIYKFLISLTFIDGVIIPFFTIWGGLIFTQIMILQSWFMLCIFLLEIPSGAIADYLGRKNTLFIATIIGIMAIIIYSSIANFFIFMLGELFWAFSAALISGALEAFIYDKLKENGLSRFSRKFFSRSEIFMLLGFSVSAPLGSLIAYFIGLRYTMLFISIPYIIAAIITLMFKEPQIETTISRKSYFKILKNGVNTFFREKNLLIIAINYIIIYVIGYLMIWLYQPMLNQVGISIIYYGLISTASTGFQIFMMNSYHKLEGIFKSRKYVLLFTALITVIMYIVGGLTLYIPLVIISIVLIKGIGLSRTPIFIDYMNKYIPSSERSTTLSTINMFQKLIIMIVNPIIGWSVAYWSLNYTLIIIGVVSLVFIFIFRIKERQLLIYDKED
ncbi:MAG: MFS transporter [Candidatus Lokiarchaeota archaeon]|nr:MFS transporter [Candidatus Lokiarchaeota archaeon]